MRSFLSASASASTSSFSFKTESKTRHQDPVLESHITKTSRANVSGCSNLPTTSSQAFPSEVRWTSRSGITTRHQRGHFAREPDACPTCGTPKQFYRPSAKLCFDLLPTVMHPYHHCYRPWRTRLGLGRMAVYQNTVPSAHPPPWPPPLSVYTQFVIPPCPTG